MKNFLLLILLCTFSGFAVNAQCNWINGSDASIPDDNGRGILDWNAHYNYALNAPELLSSSVYVGNRVTNLKNCLSQEMFASSFASVSLMIARCGIQYAGWVNSPDNAIPGCGILDSMDHYSYAIGGNNNMGDLSRQKMKYLSENIDKEVYARLYADVSVALAKAGTAPATTAVIPPPPVPAPQVVTPPVAAPTPPPAPTEVPAPVPAPEPFNRVIKIATLFPKTSTWGKALQTWAKAVNEKTGGKLELQILYNGAGGDEAAIVSKIKMGQVDVGVISSAGYYKIYKPILALQIPGLFKDWATFDNAREAMKPDFEKGTKDAGFTNIGWFDIGKIRILSKGFEVKTLDDIKGKKPFQWKDDNLQPLFYQTIGGVTPVPMNTPEVLPALNTGNINLITTPCLFAEQMQWAQKLDYFTMDADAFAVGGIVMSTKRLDGMPAELKTIFLETAKLYASSLTKKIRVEDDAAFTRLNASKALIARTPAEQAKWNTLYKQYRLRLAQGTFTPELISKLEQLAGQ